MFVLYSLHKIGQFHEIDELIKIYIEFVIVEETEQRVTTICMVFTLEILFLKLSPKQGISLYVMHQFDEW